MLLLRRRLLQKTVQRRFVPTRLLGHCFSTSNGLSKTVAEIQECIKQDLKQHTSNDSFKDYLKEFLELNSWVMSTSQDNTRIELSKAIGPREIKVVYQAQLPQPFDEVHTPEDRVESDEKDRDGSQYTEFLVILSNGAKSKLVFDMIIINNELSVNGAFISEDPLIDIESRFKSNPENRYIGPDFETLSDDLQASIVAYLNEMGINADLADFIVESSIYFDAQLQQDMLVQFQEFLA